MLLGAFPSAHKPNLCPAESSLQPAPALPRANLGETLGQLNVCCIILGCKQQTKLCVIYKHSNPNSGVERLCTVGSIFVVC